nr:3,4-dihydroxy-2-butanone-4-phosphate synthase [Rhodococcus sp. (in: high G+C Gram-positive bacteria)]
MALTLDSRAAVREGRDTSSPLDAGAPAVVFNAGSGQALIVAAARSVSTSTAAFVIRHSSGFLQIALPQTRCESLLLPPLNPFDPPGSRMCVGVDAVRGTGTGISAADRATTARALTDPAAALGDFTRPGHLVPISVDPHDDTAWSTPAAIALDLVHRTGQPDGALFAELVGIADPTRMMTYAECVEFARHHALPLHTIE